jgi:pyrroline-5-carboxylate reductase
MTSVVLIGLGRMGAALITGWTTAGVTPLYFIDRKAASRSGAIELASMADVADLPRPLVVVLAVKPGAGPEVLAELAPWLRAKDLVISVMAGVSLETLRRFAGEDVDVVRAMPNIAFAMGRSATAAVADPGVSTDNLAACDRLLGGGGGLTWLSTEQALTAATAISGSGLAYVFLFAEHLARAGQDLGLCRSSAMGLARDVLAGAGAMAAEGEALAAMRDRITSPGGTTAAALAVFERDDNLRRLVVDAAHAAARRSAELSADTVLATRRPSPCP